MAAVQTRAASGIRRGNRFMSPIESRQTLAVPYVAEKGFQDYFRSPDHLSVFMVSGPLSADAGYFKFGESVCYGRCVGATPSALATGVLPQLSASSRDQAHPPSLPFALSEVVTNLQQERYRKHFHSRLERLTATTAARKAYYFVRPLLGVSVRKHLQRIQFSGWNRISFPAWPVDVTVDTLMRHAMAQTLRSYGIDRVPFIWFWPDGADSCVLMTHDIEGRTGREFSPQLMDLDDSFGIKSSFQIVPEDLADASGLVESVRRRGFEVNVHDLHHDGTLFRDKRQFEDHARRINRHARNLGCAGFRSGAMYREQTWFDALNVSYDMSVPNVAHLEPQRGGCCTVMPYFIGDILELPLTTTQDYSLFNILNDYSTALWERQIEIIRSQNGLISFITHPDYLVEPRARGVYEKLLARLSQLRAESRVWVTLPADINRWWRNRRQMVLVNRGGSWSVEGPDAARARVAYATLDHDRVVYSFDEAAAK